MRDSGLESMQFEWGNPWVFWAIFLPIIVFLLIPALRLRSSAIVVPFFKRATQISGLKPRPKSYISKKNFFQWIFTYLAYGFMLVALANPKYVGQPEMEVKTARSFLIAADLSFSMDTKDWTIDGNKVTRWEAVQDIMGDFIEGRKSDRIGLVLFASHPFLQTPLTNDLNVVDYMLNDAAVGMAGQMTSIGDAIGYSMKIFQNDTTEKKVLLLLTDGNDAGIGTNPLDAAVIAAKDSVKIYTLGIGESSGRDKIDETSLKAIAKMTNGQYFRAIDSEELEKAYAALDELEPIEYKETSLKPEVLLYPVPAAIGGLIALTVVIMVVIIKKMRS